MIGPTTRVFGVVAASPETDGHVARIYNALFGFNGLDAAYLSFYVRPDVLHFTLTGFSTTRDTEELHVVPAHQEGAAKWAGLSGAIDAISFDPQRGELRDGDPERWLSTEAVCARALADAERWFGRTMEAPPDWQAVVTETTMRPCKLTHDDFPRPHGRTP